MNIQTPPICYELDPPADASFKKCGASPGGSDEREELGSIINFYVTPVTRLEFLVGKQIPYVALAMLNFFLLAAFAVFGFRVPFTGSFLAFASAAFLYVIATTAIGWLFRRS